MAPRRQRRRKKRVAPRVVGYDFRGSTSQSTKDINYSDIGFSAVSSPFRVLGLRITAAVGSGYEPAVIQIALYHNIVDQANSRDVVSVSAAKVVGPNPVSISVRSPRNQDYGTSVANRAICTLNVIEKTVLVTFSGTAWIQSAPHRLMTTVSFAQSRLLFISDKSAPESE